MPFSPSSIICASRKTPVVGVRAARTFDFIDTLGVNTHMQFGGAYSNPANSLAGLQYLGIHHIRDAATTSTWTSQFLTLGQAGIKATDIYGSNDSSYGSQSSVETQQALANAPYLFAIEGPNEVPNGLPNPQNGLTTAPQIMGYIKSMITSNPSLAAVKIVCFTVLSSNPPDYVQYGDMSSICDYGNSHVYFGGGIAPYDQLNQFGRPLAVLDCPGKPNQITECGYTTATIQGGGNQAVTNNVAARYNLDMAMAAWSLGCSRHFKYELVDEGVSGLQEESYGYFNNDWSPKLSATSMHNMTTLLADAGGTAASFTTGSLNYTLTNLPAKGHSALFQKANGEFWLSVWAEPVIWNDQTMTEVTPPTVSVTANLGRSFTTVNVYDPLIGTTAINTQSSASSVVLSITDHPLLVRCIP